MSAEQIEYLWQKQAVERTKGGLGGIVGVVVILGIGAGFFIASYYFVAAAFAVLAFTSFPSFLTPQCRFLDLNNGVQALPRKFWQNTNVVAPSAVAVVAVLVSVQLSVDWGTQGQFWLLGATALFWFGTVVVVSSAVRYRGPLSISSDGVTLGRNSTFDYSDLVVEVIMANKSAFPHLKLSSTKSGRSQLIFPVKNFGLEANSVFSTLTHLAHVDAETRRSYNARVLKAMLTYRPDHEVADGGTVFAGLPRTPRDPRL